MTNRGKLRLYRFLSFIVYVIPFAFIVVYKFDLFIKYDVTKLSLYFYLTAMFVAVGMKDKLFNTAKKNPTLTLSTVLFVTAIIMQHFATELMLISLAGICGSVLSAIIEPVVSIYYNACFEQNGDYKKRIITDDIPQKQAWKKAYF